MYLDEASMLYQQGIHMTSYYSPYLLLNNLIIILDFFILSDSYIILKLIHKGTSYLLLESACIRL